MLFDLIAPPVPNNGSVDGPWMNDIQTVIFKADAICGGSGALGESAFVKRSGMPIEQAVLIGEAGPGVAGGVIESIEPGRPGINNLNTFAFHSTVTAGATNTEIIYTRTVGVSPLLPPIVRVKAGDAAPRTSGTFTSLSAPGINQTGSLIFHADITGDPSVTQGIFYSVGGITGAIAIEGDTMPGTNGQTFCSSIEEGSLSDDARFVFMNESFLEGPLCSPFGVFATSPLPPPPPGVLRPDAVLPPTITPVALEGDLAPGTNGGVFGFACIRGTCGSDGTTVFDEPSINTSGDVVFIGGVILPPRPQLRNISTRGVVMDGDKVLIGGFMLRGVDSKSVLIRGLGPSLSVNGVPLANRMANPTIKLMQGSTELAQNNDWRSDQQTEIAATGLPPEFDTEAALVRTLAPGDYSVILGGADNTTGLGLVEIYDLDYSRLAAFANISTRGLVEPGDHALIGGIIIQPPANPPANLPQVMPSTVRVIVRAIGPSMNVNGQPVPGRLADPTLDLYDANGSTVFSNDDWVNSLQMSEIIASGLAPTDPKESAIIGNFAPGSFTAVVRGAGGTSGIALVEAYELNPPSFSR